MNLVQTNEYGVNVLVQSELTPNHKHIHYSDFKVKDVKVLTKEEILEKYKEAKEEEIVEAAKSWLKRQEGFAVSNCGGKDVPLKHGDIVSYVRSE